MAYDEELLGKSINNARRMLSRHKEYQHTYLWVVVRDLFGVGSTTAHELCRRFGYEPNERVREVKKKQ